MKEKIKSILTKTKDNKKKVIGITLGVFLTFIFTFAVYNMNNPTYFNRLFASIGSTPNEAFEDSDFYNCVIDSYNFEHQDNKKVYTDNLTDEELANITKVSCYSEEIENTSGIEKIINLKKLSLDNNLFQSIDLSNNTLLEELSIINEKVDNQLTNINLNNNKKLKVLDLSYNAFQSIDLSNNVNLTELNLEYNRLTTIDLGNNALLTDLNLRYNKLSNVDLSNNVSLTDLTIYCNQLTSLNLSNNKALKKLNLSENQLTSIDLSNNKALTSLDLSENQLINIDLSNNTALTSLTLDDNPLSEDMLMQNGEVYTIEEKIIPPSGQSFNYSIDDTTVASIQGNTITALKEGNTTLRTTFGNISFTRKLAVGNVKFLNDPDDMVINNEEKYIYYKTTDEYLLTDEWELQNIFNPNVGKIVRNGDLLKVVIGDKTYLEYKIVYFNGGTNYVEENEYAVITAYNDEPNKYNIKTINCSYEFINDGREISIKYNNKEIDRKKVVYIYLPKEFKFGKIFGELLYIGDNLLDDSIINNINDISQINKNKINILNAKMTYKTDDGNYFGIVDGDERVSYFSALYINSNNYDLKNEYIYLGTNDFNSDLMFYDDEYDKVYFDVISNNNNIYIMDDSDLIYYWSLIKVTSDKYDMSGDKIDLKGEDIDLSKINVTNALLKVDNNKLLVMYNDEVVKEFKLENGKKPTTTKPNGEEKTTTSKVTTKENKKITTKETTTKKKESIIDKIFGKSETTTKKEETTTTKKTNILKRTNKTTKIESNSGSVTNDSKNSTNKIVTKSNIIILLLSITTIGLIIYIIINKKKVGEVL